jgi:hypothetical protein
LASSHKIQSRTGTQKENVNTNSILSDNIPSQIPSFIIPKNSLRDVEVSQLSEFLSDVSKSDGPNDKTHPSHSNAINSEGMVTSSVQETNPNVRNNPTNISSILKSAKDDEIKRTLENGLSSSTSNASIIQQNFVETKEKQNKNIVSSLLSNRNAAKDKSSLPLESYENIKESVQSITYRQLQEELTQLRYDFHKELQVVLREQHRQFEISRVGYDIYDIYFISIFIYNLG